jgi:hypothetical protein
LEKVSNSTKSNVNVIHYPAPLLLKKGHLYLGEKGTFLLWVDNNSGKESAKKAICRK